MADFYWVGGSGSWNTTDTTHWSLTSGGTGGAGVPSSVDKVYFDANSGTGVVNIYQSVNVSSMFLMQTSVALYSANVINISTYKVVQQGDVPITNAITLILLPDSTEGIYVNDATTKTFKKIVSNGGDVKIGTNTTEVESIVFNSSIRVPAVSFRTIECVLGTTVQIDNKGIFIGFLLDVRTAITSGYKIHAYGGSITFDGVSTSILGSNDSKKPSYLLSNIIILSGTFTFSKYIKAHVVEIKPTTTKVRFPIDGNVTIIDDFICNGSISNTVLIESTGSGVRAKIDLSGAFQSAQYGTSQYVSVRDIYVYPDYKMLSMTTDSVNRGNNWGWYFDNFNRPTSNLLFGSPV